MRFIKRYDKVSTFCAFNSSSGSVFSQELSIHFMCNVNYTVSILFCLLTVIFDEKYPHSVKKKKVLPTPLSSQMGTKYRTSHPP